MKNYGFPRNMLYMGGNIHIELLVYQRVTKLPMKNADVNLV